MTDVNTAAFDDNAGKHTTTETVTEVVPGVFGSLWNTITANKIVSTVVLGAAAGGAGYLAYMRLRDEHSAEEIGRTLDQAAAAAARLLR